MGDALHAGDAGAFLTVREKSLGVGGIRRQPAKSTKIHIKAYLHTFAAPEA